MNAPNLVDLLAAEWAQQEPPRQSLVGRIISGDCFYLISGAMVALDLVLVIALVRR
jgi:hypothetical protein